jgi:hypothetical protein
MLMMMRMLVQSQAFSLSPSALLLPLACALQSRGTLPAPTVHTTLAVQLDPSSKTIGVQATTRQVRALLHAFRPQFEALSITTLPPFNASAQDSAPTTAQLVLGTDSGLQLLSVPLPGSPSVSRVLGTVGLPWPFANDVVVLSNAKLQLRPVAGSFSVDADISIPSLGISAQPGAVHWRRTSAAVEVRSKRGGWMERGREGRRSAAMPVYGMQPAVGQQWGRDVRVRSWRFVLRVANRSVTVQRGCAALRMVCC